jgi:hypothetical protein
VEVTAVCELTARLRMLRTAVVYTVFWAVFNPPLPFASADTYTHANTPYLTSPHHVLPINDGADFIFMGQRL